MKEATKLHAKSEVKLEVVGKERIKHTTIDFIQTIEDKQGYKTGGKERIK